MAGDTLTTSYTARRAEMGNSYLIHAPGGLAVAVVPGADETTRQRAETFAAGPELLAVVRALAATSVLTPRNRDAMQAATELIRRLDGVEIGG
jgi:hypothetical protein